MPSPASSDHGEAHEPDPALPPDRHPDRRRDRAHVERQPVGDRFDERPAGAAEVQPDVRVDDVVREHEVVEADALEEVHDPDVRAHRDQHAEEEPPLAVRAEHQRCEAEHEEGDDPEAVQQCEPGTGHVERVRGDRRRGGEGGGDQEHDVHRSEAQRAIGHRAHPAEDEGHQAEDEEDPVEGGGDAEDSPVAREDLGGDREREQPGGRGHVLANRVAVDLVFSDCRGRRAGRRAGHRARRARRSIHTARPRPRRPPATRPIRTPASSVERRLLPVAVGPPAGWMICELISVGWYTPA